jgi:hypothetical protein
MSLIKKYFEGILILLALSSAVLALGQVRVAPLCMMTSFLALSFYYLLSAILVLTDKRISKPVRLTFVVGLYVVSIGIVGSLFKLLLWRGGDTLMIVALSSAVAVLIVVAAFRVLLNKEARTWAWPQLAVLLKRLVPYAVTFALISFHSDEVIFENFNYHRRDQAYKELLLKSLDDPGNQALKDSLQSYRTKHF